MSQRRQVVTSQVVFGISDATPSAAPAQAAQQDRGGRAAGLLTLRGLAREAHPPDPARGLERL
ncbi:hypothetical protein, partial [Allorhizocola rhizosphaerae]|uniref:hypothetical protein n=1 Tax=Allorhizocola rhizosphaerae TaxID=1872709 RepID=UPI0013C3464F